jgi:hypothetical protein
MKAIAVWQVTIIIAGAPRVTWSKLNMAHGMGVDPGDVLTCMCQVWSPDRFQFWRWSKYTFPIARGYDRPPMHTTLHCAAEHVAVFSPWSYEQLSVWRRYDEHSEINSRLVYNSSKASPNDQLRGFTQSDFYPQTRSDIAPSYRIWHLRHAWR